MTMCPPLIGVGLVPLDPGRAEADQALALGLERSHPLLALEPGSGADVEVHAVLGGLALGHALEEHPRTVAVGVLAGGRAVAQVLGQRLPEGVPAVEARAVVAG